MKKLLTISLILGSVHIMVYAQVIQVPADQPTIQAGIDVATDGDTVLVADSIYYENINFKGKAITVASQFIMDGDTSHISKTIIDGSQFTDWKRGSTVLMESGEDTTSVLMGFTITGGSGTEVTRGTWTAYFGAGVNIMNSGGKVLHNIITGNHMTSTQYEYCFGGGINASVNGNHTAIIRNNMIIDNSVTSTTVYGAGISIDGGRCIVESNTIKNNKLEGKTIIGAGIFWFNEGDPGTIEEVFIRNNLITANEGIRTGTEQDYGGAIGTGSRFPEGIIEIYNNVISYNAIMGQGGGFYNYANPALVYNNTFYNNSVEDGGNQIFFRSGQLYMFNNIVWSDLDNGNEDIHSSGGLVAYGNLFKKPLNLSGAVTERGNVYLEPVFKSDLFELAENSPGIGRGIDSIWVDSTWYKVPAFDFKGNPRPADIDQYVDIGALESEYEQPIYSNADLASAGMIGHATDPPFHKDTLNYLLVKAPGNTIIGKWRIHAADNLATVEMDTAADLLSENELDRTSTILVTASDGITQKQYTIVYKYLSSDATLASLEVSLGELDPSFDPSVTAYYDTIPYGVGTVPEVTCIATDTSATVTVKPASDIYNRFEALRTTTIYVTSPNDLVTQEYTILFTVDLTRPELTVLQDSVELGEEIGVVVYEPAQVYLVPASTAGVYDSIVNEKLAWTEAGDADTVSLSTEGLDTTGTFWIYACGRHQSLSESHEIVINTTVAVPEIYSKVFRVYPNPASHTLYLETTHAIKSIELYNVLGKPVLKVLNPEGKISVNHLSDGIYFLRAVVENMDVITTRVIKF